MHVATNTIAILMVVALLFIFSLGFPLPGTQAVAGNSFLEAIFGGKKSTSKSYIEAFLKKYPNAIVSFGVSYHAKGHENDSKIISGLTGKDIFEKSKAKSNLILAKSMYDSRILPDHMWKKLIKKADRTIDLALSGRIEKDPAYANKFIEHELLTLPSNSIEIGYSIIRNAFDNNYDGMSLERIKTMNPTFYLQLSSENMFYVEDKSDAIKRVSGEDPTPPL
jgi:hypothetical protein